MSIRLETKIEFLKGIGPQRAQLLNTELQIFTFNDLLHFYPFRHEDRSVFYTIRQTHEDMAATQIKGKIISFSMVGGGAKKRLVAQFKDDTGIIELVWFQGIRWVTSKLKPNIEYIVYGKPNLYGSKLSIAHPEVEPISESALSKKMVPVYHTTERLKNSHVDSKVISKLMATLFETIKDDITETLPDKLIQAKKLLPLKNALYQIHFPKNEGEQKQAEKRIKFEELFFHHLRVLKVKQNRKITNRGFVFKNIPTLTTFYNNHLPFDLTGAQKRVLKEIYKDVCSGNQMNRLLQGDVGSGKTIVAFIAMLMAIDNGYQACLMAPTEILAQQHVETIKKIADPLSLKVELLTGSTKKSVRGPLLENLANGSTSILIGTHALLEDPVVFKELGIAIIDEQHRFGVRQRSKLWNKNKTLKPHVLVMTATPIPRTLAMTLYGDLDLSIIDELPVGRKPIKTVHRNDRHRIQVFGFIEKQLEEGRQIYIVYPLIEESEKTDLKDLYDGYEAISRRFGDNYAISILHGKMASEDKEYEMHRFLKNETKIMVATTVIEVGVNVPNASVMVIENAERFGLSQLHQLRGRVGRGADQSYCILMTKDNLGNDSKVRIGTMVETTDGFRIADVDLKLRGPGDLTGTAQSGSIGFKLTNLSEDTELIIQTRMIAEELLAADPELKSPENLVLRQQLVSGSNLSQIS